MKIDLWQECTVLEVGIEVIVKHTLSPGIYELEQHDNPVDREEEPWLIVAGTTIGAAKWWWHNRAPATFL